MYWLKSEWSITKYISTIQNTKDFRTFAESCDINYKQDVRLLNYNFKYLEYVIEHAREILVYFLVICLVLKQESRNFNEYL